MGMTTIVLRLALLGLLAWFGAANPAAADDITSYPNKPIHIIVPFAPGGASDFAIRLIQQGLQQALGQQLVIDNRTGAAGNVGMETAARAAPDGYTLFLGNIGTISINPHFFADMKVAPLRDFIPISLASETPGIVVASPKFPPNSLKELIAYAKANPGKINYAAAGVSTLNTLAMEQFRLRQGLKMTQVPYKGGAGPAVIDLMAGNVDVMFVTLSSAAEFVKAGKLKGLAVTTTEARRVAARRAERGRARLSRGRQRFVAGPVRGRRHAAADRRQAARRGAEGDGRSGRAQAHDRSQHAADLEPHAGELQGIPRRRLGEMGNRW